MLKAKNELEKYLEQEILNITARTEVINNICNYMKDEYDIPRSLTSDLITMRVSLSETNEFVLFCLMNGIENVLNKNGSYLENFFTEQEIKNYKSSKYKTDKIKFPLRFKVMQVTEDQWNGVIDIKTLMKLRKAQLINYNVNAQRTMQRIVMGDKEVYKITLNQEAISSIEKMYRNGTYIPTPFTLNIPLDTESDFYYDSEQYELVIKSLKHFDITDGYHRYVAACKMSDLESSFNYNMELRIINFSDDKAKQFIYQEDQKTKMRKIDSNSLNMNKAANIVVTRVNESPQCNLQGLIGRNQSIINFGELADLVQYFYFKGVNKEKEKSVIINTVKELIEDFNMLTEYNLKYLEKRYSYKQLVTAMYIFYYYKDKDKTNMCELIEETIKKVNKLDNKKFYSKIAKKTMMNEIENLIKDVD